MELEPTLCTNIVTEFIEPSKDGYGLFDADDVLIYCNPAYAELYYYNSRDEFLGETFEHMVRTGHEQHRGVKIDSDNVDEFIAYAKTVRRSRPFRLFEVDFIDGRWFLFSEQTGASGELLVQIKDITKQKVLERNLETTVETLSQLALTDELTRVANRRGFVESVESELNRCRRSGASMTLALLDMDFFKRVNDRFGHQAGDAALKHVADLVKKTLRNYDIFGRIGGEEFAIFLSNTSQQTALEITDRIRAEIARYPLLYNDQEVALSVSVGLTTEGCNTSFEQLYTEADAALYQAKEQGRNRVIAFGNPAP